MKIILPTANSRPVNQDSPADRLQVLAERASYDLGDTAAHRKGKNVRPAGQLKSEG